MTSDLPAHPRRFSLFAPWSNRILLLALAGILFLTLFPFHFELPGKILATSSALRLGGEGRKSGPLDALLNVLLFMPFGFGLAEKLRDRRWGRISAFIAIWIAGSLLSYSVEFLQLYIPARDSGWMDVFTNGTGAVAGFLLFELIGQPLVAIVASAESALRNSLTIRRAAFVLPIYFALWFALSSSLQKQTRLTNWDPQSQLLIGNDAAEPAPQGWEGTVSRVDLWSRAIPGDFAQALTAGQAKPGAQSSLLASYDFLSQAPLQDQLKFLPDLFWTPRLPQVGMRHRAVLDGQSWLASQAPVPNLVAALQRTNQFSIEFACTPAETAGTDARIISISNPRRPFDLDIRQEDSNLVFWFRTPLTVGDARLPWEIPGVFAAGQPRDILFTYDGSDGSLYVNGTKNPGAYELGPGAAFAKSIRSVKSAELEGYKYIYDGLIFLPAGALFGIAIWPFGPREIPAFPALILAIEFVIPPWLLDRILSRVSGRQACVESILLCLILVAAGTLWMNADVSSQVR